MRSRADSRVELSFWFRALARASSRSASRLAASSSWIRRGASTSRRRNSLTSASRAARAASRPAWSSRSPSCGAWSFRSESSMLVSSATTLPAPARALRLPGDTQVKDVKMSPAPGRGHYTSVRKWAAPTDRFRSTRVVLAEGVGSASGNNGRRPKPREGIPIR